MPLYGYCEFKLLSFVEEMNIVVLLGSGAMRIR